MNLAPLVQSLKNQRLFVDYVFVSGSTIFIYDYFLTLHLEVKLIWLSQWTYSNVIFLLVRYTTFGLVFCVLLNQVATDVSMETCRVSFPTSVTLLVTLVSLADVILAIRTWAVWHMNRLVGIGLAILVVVDVAVRYAMMCIFLKSLAYASPPYPGYRGCIIEKGHRILWVNYALMTVLESCFLALMAISAFRSYRHGKTSELWNVIHRDGIMFYVYVLGFTVLNLVLGLATSLDTSVMFNPMQAFIYSALTTRIVLTIRSARDHQGRQPELHTGYESPGNSIPLCSSDYDEVYGQETVDLVLDTICDNILPSDHDRDT